VGWPWSRSFRLWSWTVGEPAPARGSGGDNPVYRELLWYAEVSDLEGAALLSPYGDVRGAGIDRVIDWYHSC